MLKFKRIFCALLCIYPLIIRGEFDELIPVSSYGWMDQYSLNSRHHFVGDEACVPTTSTNALTYLQNAAPFVFGDTLSGTTYPEWDATDELLINLMGTKPVVGTYYNQFVYAINDYIIQTKGFSEVQFSGMYPSNNWSTTYPQPSYMIQGVPSIPFISNAIAAGSAVLVSLEYDNGGGHELLFNGLSWDPSTETGVVYFVDPLDPSQNYSPDVPLGPVKQSIGTLELSGDGTKLVLNYSQYQGSLPYNGVYEKVKASLFGVLSIGSAPFVPFSQLISGNAHKIAQGFDFLDPTTSAMFPVMAVLNTSTDIEGAFAQMDPSVFDPILYTSQAAAEKVRVAVTNNLWQYRCGCLADTSCVRFWATPFDAHQRQKGSHTHSGYKGYIKGVVTGVDYLVCQNLIAGAGFSFAKNNVRWTKAHAKGGSQNYGGIIYGLWNEAPFRVDTSFGYTYDHVKAHRNLSLFSTIPFVSPIKAKLSHKENSHTYMGHIGGSYDIYKGCYNDADIVVWPYVNVDCIYARRPSFKEKGNAIFAEKISKKDNTLVLSEIGIGGSFCRPFYCNYSSFLHATLSYVNETRFGGRYTHAYFNSSPVSEFSVVGIYPQNNLFRPSVIVGIKSPEDLFRVHIAYQGNFSSDFTGNEVFAEVSLAF